MTTPCQMRSILVAISVPLRGKHGRETIGPPMSDVGYFGKHVLNDRICSKVPLSSYNGRFTVEREILLLLTRCKGWS